jgi:hypothetical protein
MSWKKILVLGILRREKCCRSRVFSGLGNALIDEKTFSANLEIAGAVRDSLRVDRTHSRQAIHTFVGNFLLSHFSKTYVSTNDCI